MAVEERTPSENQAFLGPDALRAYALVYCSRALKEGGRAAGKTMDAVRELLTTRRFNPGDPVGSQSLDGYISSSDALWLRHYQVLFPGPMTGEVTSTLETQHLVFYEGRTLARRLRSFGGSEGPKDWKDQPVSVGSLPKADKEGVESILGARTPASMPFRGYLLVGYDKHAPGLVQLGVRPHRWLVNADQEERLRWLQWPPDFVRPFLPDVGEPDLSFCLAAPPSADQLIETRWGFRSMARSLLLWHGNPTPNPWNWRRPRFHLEFWTEMERLRFGTTTYRACILPLVESTKHAAEHLRRALCFGPWMEPVPTREELIVSAQLPAEELGRAIAELVRMERPDFAESARFLVVDRSTIEALARRYPWIWRLEGEAIRQKRDRLTAFTETSLQLAENLALGGFRGEALTALQSLLVLARPLNPWWLLDWLCLHLITLEKDRPWALVRDLARAFRPAWHWVRRERPSGEEAFFASTIESHPGEVLSTVPADAWAVTPEVGGPEWRSLVKMLAIWRSFGSGKEAVKFVDGLRKRLQDHSGDTAIIDTAWEESRRHIVEPVPGGQEEDGGDLRRADQTQED